MSVTLGIGVEKDALMVPNQVVQTGQDGNYVYVVKEDRTVEMWAVTTGMPVNDDVVIEKEWRPGRPLLPKGNCG